MSEERANSIEPDPAAGNLGPTGGASTGNRDGDAGPRDIIDPALAASLAAGAAWLAGKGVHRVRKKRAASKGSAKTLVGRKISSIGWTAAAAIAAAVVEAVVSRLIRRSRGR
jgi:hypothetical protein